MKPIDKTEAYNQAMRGVRISYGGGEGLITLQADVQFRQCMTIESELLNDYEVTQCVTEELARNLVRSVIRYCGISHKDISLLEIAKELAAEDDGEGTYTC